MYQNCLARSNNAPTDAGLSRFLRRGVFGEHEFRREFGGGEIGQRFGPGLSPGGAEISYDAVVVLRLREGDELFHSRQIVPAGGPDAESLVEEERDRLVLLLLRIVPVAD